MARQFTDSEAKRERVPLLIGLVSPSGAGKTYSALRLATGIVSVCGGEVFGVDTEAKRMLHYAWDPEKRTGFKFRHVPFGPPYNPLSYLDVIRYCLDRKAGCVIIDSMSHEHEGEGGVLDMHETELQRFTRNVQDERDLDKARDKNSARAWIMPKGERRKLTSGIVQSGGNFIFCFRAQEKLDWKNKTQGQPTNQGWQPIGAMPLIYEMTARALMHPGAGGVPDWKPDIDAERKLIKLPEQFRALFERYKGKPIDEEMGAEMARWACGTEAQPQPVEQSKEFSARAAEIAAATNVGELESLLPVLTEAKKRGSLSKVEIKSLADAYAQRKIALTTPSREPGEDG